MVAYVCTTTIMNKLKFPCSSEVAFIIGWVSVCPQSESALLYKEISSESENNYVMVVGNYEQDKMTLHSITSNNNRHYFSFS